MTRIEPSAQLPPSDVEIIAAEVLAALAEGRPIVPLSSRYPGLDLDCAYRVTAAIKELRAARGERPVGRKIGFTNRTIWAECGVYAPIWGYIYDTTVRDVAAASAQKQVKPQTAPETCRQKQAIRSSDLALDANPSRGQPRGLPVFFGSGRWGSISRHSASVRSVW